MMIDSYPPHTSEACQSSIAAVQDALYVLSGKWKITLIAALINGPKRFNELQRSLEGITPKVLSKELRDLELNEFVERKIYDTVPVTVIYEITPYACSVQPIIDALRSWGENHKNRIKQNRRIQSTSVKQA
jgi:DNA-binding HxlR family transcriptional regulator